MKRATVVLAEPSVMVAAGMKQMLAGEGIVEVKEVVQEVSLLPDVLARIKPDMLILNPLMLDAAARNALREQPGISSCPVLVALVYGFVEQRVLKQFDGIVEIGDDGQKMVYTLREALRAHEMTWHVATDESQEISERERDVLVLIAKGMSNKEIAHALNLSVHTVMSHRRNIVRKTGIHSVAGLTVYALVRNWVEEYEIQ